MPADKPLKITDPALALEKLKHWCAYQERCHQEVRDKLYDYGLWPDAVESIIAALISENFLNEERFATAFARGKFRIKKWGRVKIKIELKRRKVSDYCIRKALRELEGDDYTATLRQVIASKDRQLKEPHPLKRRYKLISHALSRGFERDLVMDALQAEDC